MHSFELVVIGAHFGVWLKDEISKCLDKNILLVEPVPYNYEILKQEYSKLENIKICTNAIYDQNKKEKFYFVKKESISKLGKHWASGIGSFDKQHILNHKTKRFKIENNDIQEIDINFITFDDLVKKYSIKSINKLQIDVEGAESKILNSIDFSKIEIRQIIFEFKHFDGTFKEGEKLEAFKKKLSLIGYRLKQLDKENILAEK